MTSRAQVGFWVCFGFGMAHGIAGNTTLFGVFLAATFVIVSLPGDGHKHKKDEIK